MRIVKQYNETYDSGIKQKPEEAQNDKLGIAMIENDESGRYARRLACVKIYKFKVGDDVRVVKSENPVYKPKEFKSVF